MNNFEVVGSGGYVDIFPDADVALNAEVLTRITELIKTELNFSAGISIGDGPEILNTTHQLGIRLHGGSAEIAQQLREMDLFPVLQPEKLDAVEFRFVHEGKAYVDPRLTLTVGEFVSCAHALRAQFGRHSGIEFKRGQLRYATNSSCDNLNDKMIDFCQPLYRAASKIAGANDVGQRWIKISGPAQLRDRLAEFDNVLQEPQPILHKGFRLNDPCDLWFAVDADPVERVTDVERFYATASAIALELGVHPVGDFQFTHNPHSWTIFKPSPLSSR